MEEGSDEEITPPTKSKAPTKVDLEEEKSQFVKKKEVTKEYKSVCNI